MHPWGGGGEGMDWKRGPLFHYTHAGVGRGLGPQLKQPTSTHLFWHAAIRNPQLASETNGSIVCAGKFVRHVGVLWCCVQSPRDCTSVRHVVLYNATYGNHQISCLGARPKTKLLQGQGCQGGTQ